jgi:hypothetical protein
MQVVRLSVHPLYKYRWFRYALAGLGFGVFDWYYLEFLIRFDWPRTLFTTVIAVSLNWGIWLVPALPLAIAEVQRSQRIRLSACAVALFWLCAITAYYLYYGFLLAFDGSAPLSLRAALTHPSPTAWADWWSILRSQTLYAILDWSWMALGGGALVGARVGILHQLFRSRMRAHIR